MKIDTALMGNDLSEAGPRAVQLEELGYDGA